MSKGAVSQWLTRAKTQGVQALRRHPAPGRQPKISAEQLAQVPAGVMIKNFSDWLDNKISAEQLAQVPAIVAKGAEAFGFRGQVWTTQRVAQVIKRELGVSYHPAHWSRLLRLLKQRVQKPVQRASQRDEATIQRWKEEQWPALKKTVGAKGASEGWENEGENAVKVKQGDKP